MAIRLGRGVSIRVRLLEVIRERPVADSWQVVVTTQMQAESIPGTYAVAGLTMQGCEQQRQTVACASSRAVHIHVADDLVRLTPADFARSAPRAIVAAKRPERCAFRLSERGDRSPR